MDDFLFVISLSEGQEIMGVKVDPLSGLYQTALYVINAARDEYPDEDITSCEVWKRVDPNTLKLILTVYAQ